MVITRIELSRLAALQGEPAVALSGRVGGYIPLQLQRDSIAVRQGRLANETPLSLAILPSSGAQAMAQSNRAVSLALDALNPLRIQQFQAGVDMAADGWLDAAVRIQGINPQKTRCRWSLITPTRKMCWNCCAVCASVTASPIRS